MTGMFYKHVERTREYLDEACNDQLSSVSSLSFRTTHLWIDQYPSVIINWTKIKKTIDPSQCKKFIIFVTCTMH